MNLPAAICGERVPKSEMYPAVRIICSSHPGKGRLGDTATLWGRTQSCSKCCSTLSPVSQILLLFQQNLNVRSPLNIDTQCIRKSSQTSSASPCMKRKSPPDSWHHQPWYSLCSPKCIASINISHFKELFHLPQTSLSRRPKQKADLAVSGFIWLATCVAPWKGLRRVNKLSMHFQQQVQDTKLFLSLVVSSAR